VVGIGPDEVDRMARHLDLPRESFLKQYAKKIGRDRWRLKEIANAERWCIFLERGADGLYGCRVNPVKPDQCAGFPARWRNPDSFQCCEGLKAMLCRMKEQQAGAAAD
jgi:Fe-S-cluster containining protein